MFLQGVIALVGVGAIALLLWEPHIEGVNAHATTLSEIYFDDPFLWYVYVGSIPFFVALWQAFKLLGCAGRNEVFSPAAVNSLRTIKYCAMAIIGFAFMGKVFIMLGESDDRAGGNFMGTVIIFGSIVIATAAAVFERVLRIAVDMKTENDLTV